VSAALNYYYVD